jgi:APA family basic amino acid/polyamine antiporter
LQRFYQSNTNMNKKEDNNLEQGLSLYGLIMIAVGSCIGAGVFLVPSQIATSLPSPSFILLAWLIGGLFTLTGALTFAELGSRFPQTGGVYVFLKNAFGELTAFLYGWSILTVITSGALAALAIGFAQYFNKIVGLDESFEVAVGLITIGILTVINIFGVKIGEWVASVLTTLKLIGIGIVVIIGLFLVPTDLVVNVDWSLPNIGEGTGDTGLVGGFAIALIGVLWSYGGWYHASFLAGETRNAKKVVPKAMIIGTVIVIITYLLINWAYLEMLSLEAIQNSKAPASDAISQYYEYGGLFIAILIAVSIFGTMSIYTMSAPRIYLAMAQDKIFFKQLAHINPFYKTPVNAIIVQSVWAMFLILFWQTFSDLITYVVFVDWIFLMLAAMTIFKFRQQEPSNTNIYKTPAYPIIPALFIITCLVLVSATLFEKPNQAIAGLILMAVGVGIFYLFKFKNKE